MKKLTKDEQEQLQRIGCYIWHNHPRYRGECKGQVVPHHAIGGMRCKGMAKKSPDEQSMAICVNHHTGDYGIHKMGVDTWEGIYGSQDSMIKWTINRRLEDET